jgi:hypothetical protein
MVSGDTVGRSPLAATFRSFLKLMAHEWHTKCSGKRKTLVFNEGILVAGTGFEPVTFGL